MPNSSSTSSLELITREQFLSFTTQRARSRSIAEVRSRARQRFALWLRFRRVLSLRPRQVPDSAAATLLVHVSPPVPVDCLRRQRGLVWRPVRGFGVERGRPFRSVAEPRNQYLALLHQEFKEDEEQWDDYAADSDHDEARSEY